MNVLRVATLVKLDMCSTRLLVMVISNLIKQHVDLIDSLMELYIESPNAYSLFLNK